VCCRLEGFGAIGYTQTHASAEGAWAQAAGGGGGGDTRDRGQDMDMEVTFGSGLAHVAQRLTTKKQEHDARKADTVWNQYEQRRRCLPHNPHHAMLHPLNTVAIPAV
jgi:hypothetical protein